MTSNKPFKFTKEQRDKLLSSWKHQSDRDKAWEYINHVERIIDSHVVNALPEEKSPQQERDDRKNILGLVRRLRGALLNQSVRGGHEMERFLESGHQAPEIGEGSTHREQLIAYLESADSAMTVLTSGRLPSTDRKGEYQRRRMMRGLVHSYLIHFGKYPSTAHGGNFRRFRSTLSKILDIPLGEDLQDRAIKDVKKQLRAADKIKQELKKAFPGVIPD